MDLYLFILLFNISINIEKKKPNIKEKNISLN